MPQPTSATIPAPEPVTPAAPPAPAVRHRWRFHRVGGLDQVRLDNGEDLARLDDLDPKLWVALSCPTRGLELDGRTLELLDTDRDGRVRVPEIVAAIRWCRARLVDLDVLVRGGGVLSLSELDAGRPEGRVLLGAARLVLQRLGKPGADAISVADVADTTHLYENTLFNGDGVVPPEAARDAGTRQLLLDVITCMGSVADRSGKPGIDAKRLDAFFEEAERFDTWARAGEQPDVAVLEPRTAAAGEAFLAVKAKADDFFLRCRLAAQDPRAGAAMNRAELDLLTLAAKDLAASRDEVARFPLARVEPARALPLVVGVNPAWAAALDAFRREVVAPLHGEGKTSISGEEWELIAARFLPWEAWRAKKAGAALEPLGAARVRAILAEGKSAAQALVAEDQALEAEEAAVADVVRMVHYHRDLHVLLRNFVSFSDFYNPARKAIFQAGTLYLDARSCELCVRVDDAAAHAALAGRSRMYLAYCDCRRSGGETMKIVACFTQGDADYLMVGRNGLFVDRGGRDWDATIVKVVENPISIRQAFFAPYKKLLRMIEDLAERFAASKEKAAEAQLAATAETTVGAATGAKAAGPAAVDVGKMVGIIAALGVGVGALGTLFGGFVAGFLSLQPWWAKLVAVAGILLLVSGPSMLIAWLKLRQRTLGPVLDATGWAVNGRVKVNVPLGTALTGIAVLPPGARRTLQDPFADEAARRRHWIAWALLLAVAAGLALARWYHAWPFRPH